MRKVNFAADVKEKTPQVNTDTWFKRANYCNNDEVSIDEFTGPALSLCGIIIYTYCGNLCQ